MKKIELIWREILEEGIKNPDFEQQQLALKFGFSKSTVFAALSPLREIGAIKVSGRGFKLVDISKVLFFWATHRRLSKDILYKTRVSEPVFEIEGLVPNQTIFGAYSAARMHLGEAVADYDKVYVYASNASEIEKRFPKTSGEPNVFVIAADPELKKFGKVTPVSQTFVDLWNLPDWFAKDYIRGLEEKFYAGIL